MEGNGEDFYTKLSEAIEAKENWFDSKVLQKVQDAYRLHLTCISNITDALTRRGLIVPDPYQKDKKITSIQVPDGSSFNDNERPTKLGLRLCDYQAMLDFVCNYMKFSVDQLTFEKAKKLIELNNTFNWFNLSPNSANANTRALSICLNDLRVNSQQLQVAMLGDSINKTKSALDEINKALTELMEFQKERYKCEVRRSVLQNAAFDASKATSPSTMLSEIKSLFPKLMPKRPFANELISEIVQEELSDSKEQMREAVLQKLKITEARTEKRNTEPSTHDMLMETLRTLALSSEQYTIILDRLLANNRIMQSGNNGFGQKVARFFRKILGLEEPTVEYNIVIEDPTTKQKHKESINFTEFVSSLSKRSKFYAGVLVKNSPNYVKLNAQPDATLQEFLEKQIKDNSRIMLLLAALDSYFKTAAPASERAKVKGIKMELSTLKNVLIKTNQEKAECTALAEEKEQMKNLGITNE